MKKRQLLLIGGVGGSGTRVVAQIVKSLGIHIGTNVNNSLDNLDWPGDIELMIDPTISEEQRTSSTCDLFIPFISHLISNVASQREGIAMVASKVPGSFYYLPYLTRMYTNILYIHVMRHGLDMALSSNKNQFRNWGHFFEKSLLPDCSERAAFRYWVNANRYALQNCKQDLHQRHLVIRLESLCSRSEEIIRELCSFVQIPCSHARLNKLTKLVEIPNSLGRYRKQELTWLKPIDIEDLNQLGYEIEP